MHFLLYFQSKRKKMSWLIFSQFNLKKKRIYLKYILYFSNKFIPEKIKMSYLFDQHPLKLTTKDKEYSSNSEFFTEKLY